MSFAWSRRRSSGHYPWADQTLGWEQWHANAVPWLGWPLALPALRASSDPLPAAHLSQLIHRVWPTSSPVPQLRV